MSDEAYILEETAEVTQAEITRFEEEADEIAAEVAGLEEEARISTVFDEVAAGDAPYKVVDLRGRFCSRLGNWGATTKSLGVVGHFNGPAVPARAWSDPVAWIKFINDLHAEPGRFSPGWSFDGAAYHEFIFGDTVYRIRDYGAKLPHCGNLQWNSGSLGLHIPVGVGQRPSDLTYRTLFQRVSDHNAVMKVGRSGLKGHREVGASACPGDIIQSAINSYRAGQNPGGVTPKPTPKPEPEKPAPVKPSPSKPWLPGVERIAFEDYEEKHLDEPRILTLGGKERATIVPKGVAMVVTKPPGKEPEPEKPKPPAVKPPKDELLSLVELNAIYDVLPNSEYAKRIDGLNEAMRRYDIRGPHRVSAFLGNLAAESGCLKYVREIHDGSNYEGRRDLGNIHPGDGRRFRGRGYIQITGRFNYTAASKALGYDFVSDPEAMESPKWAAVVSGWFWESRNLNHFADMGNPGWPEVCRRVNGRYPANGQAERNKYYARAWDVLVADDPRWASESGFPGYGDVPHSPVSPDPSLLPIEEEEMIEPDPTPPSPTPTPKIIASSLAGAVVVILVWMLSRFANVEVPAEVGGAAVLLFSALFGYITSER